MRPKSTPAFLSGAQSAVTTISSLSPIALAVLAQLFVYVYVHNAFLSFSCGGSIVLTFSALQQPKLKRELLSIAFFLPVALFLVAIGNAVIVRLCPRTVDPALIRLDHGMSIGIYHWTLLHGPFDLLMSLVYYGLPFFVAAVLAISPQRMQCIRAMLLASLCAPIFYFLFPAVGPAHLSDPLAPRNCIPSLHMTWALLLMRFSLPQLRGLTICFVALTALATLAKGEHYVVDLMAAVAYSVLAVVLTKRLPLPSWCFPRSRQKTYDRAFSSIVETGASTTTRSGHTPRWATDHRRRGLG